MKYMIKGLLWKGGRRCVVLCVMLMAPMMMLLAQEMNEKFSLTTQMFLNELQEKKEQTAVVAPHRIPRRESSERMRRMRDYRLIAKPDTVAGKVYISCFIHLKNASNLSEVQQLGVEVEETFDGLDFVTARVPVDQLGPLANIDNVTKIEVARCMRPLTDKAREVTNVDDVLTQSSDATALGITSKYDGTGVILGIIDTGIDFQHIAFKDKNGNSRIKRAYVYTGSGSPTEYTESNIGSATTDSYYDDHGTHTATTAGGSSVIVDGSTVTVTDDHANATYGGMAPGADLYLAGINGLNDTYLANALKKMVEYADAQGKPLVVSNSWGSGGGPRDGTGYWASLVSQYFGDSHPNRVILFASSNDAGHSKDHEGGGFFVKNNAASSSSPLGTILRSAYYSDTDAGFMYSRLVSVAWSSSSLNCRIFVLDSSTGEVKTSWTVTQNNTQTFTGLDDYYAGTLKVYTGSSNGKYYLQVLTGNEGLVSRSFSGTSFYKSDYTLAIEVYPSSGSANVDMWSGDSSYFTNHLTTSDHTWLAGSDDMCVSDEATIPDAISIGAYVSKKSWKDYNGASHTSSVYTEGDIAYFSSYATAEQSPTGVAYPWISAPGARLAAGVNHFHTADNLSYFHDDFKTDLVVNNSSNPYAMMQGTSMSTPVAAGIVALWLQASMDEYAAHKNLTVNDVKTIMEQTAINDSYTTTGANASHFGKGKIDALAGIKYILGPGGSIDPVPAITLANAASNSETLSAYNGKKVHATLADRTLTKDGNWNTLCLPFSLSAAQIAASPLAGATIKELDNTASGASLDTNNGKLTLKFTTATSITAGKPYIIKWASGDNISNPVFNGVTISNTTPTEVTSNDTNVKFVGQYSPFSITDSNKDEIILLTSGNKLGYSKNARTLNCFRAHFWVRPNDNGGVGANSYVIDFGDGETTGLSGECRVESVEFLTPEGISVARNATAAEWYSLDGRKLNKQPTAKGVYIVNGKKVVIR